MAVIVIKKMLYYLSLRCRAVIFVFFYNSKYLRA